MEYPTVHPRGFTLVEVFIVTLIIMGMGALCIPFFRSDGHAALYAAAERITADVGYAQAASMSDPSNPASITFGAAGYTVNGVAQPLSINFNESDFDEASGVTVELVNVDGSVIEFNHYGAVEGDPTADAPRIHLTAPTGETMSISIAPSTGTMTRNWGG